MRPLILARRRRIFLWGFAKRKTKKQLILARRRRKKMGKLALISPALIFEKLISTANSYQKLISPALIFEKLIPTLRGGVINYNPTVLDLPLVFDAGCQKQRNPLIVLFL